MGEKQIPYEMAREDPWAASEHFYDLNPAGCTPVLVDEDRGIILCDSRAIGEYFEETVDRAPMINGTVANRAEIRRLVALFDRSEEHTSELQSLMRNSYAVFCLKKKNKTINKVFRKITAFNYKNSGQKSNKHKLITNNTRYRHKR